MNGRGPGMRGPIPPKGKLNVKTIARLFSYFKPYKLQMVLVIICIVLSSIAGVASSMFIKTLIDDYISPMLIAANPDFGGLLRAIITMACIYAVGIVSALFITE